MIILLSEKFSFKQFIKKSFFRPPPATNIWDEVLFFKSLTKLIPSVIRWAVNLVIVAQPSSNDRPFTNDKSKSFISNDLLNE